MLKIEVTPRAVAPLERAAKWWKSNRPALPFAIARDFNDSPRDNLPERRP
ncbi:MAG: hypothetical protein ABI589_02790 [Burkholderiales bacterium]